VYASVCVCVCVRGHGVCVIPKGVVGRDIMAKGSCLYVGFGIMCTAVNMQRFFSDALTACTERKRERSRERKGKRSREREAKEKQKYT